MNEPNWHRSSPESLSSGGWPADAERLLLTPQAVTGSRGTELMWLLLERSERSPQWLWQGWWWCRYAAVGPKSRGLANRIELCLTVVEAVSAVRGCCVKDCQSGLLSSTEDSSNKALPVNEWLKWDLRTNCYDKLPAGVELVEWVPHEKEKQTCGCRCEWQSSDCAVDEWASAGWWTALLQMQPIFQAPRTSFQSLQPLFWTPKCLPMRVYVSSKDLLPFALLFFLQAHSANHASGYLPTKAYPFHFYSNIVWPNPCRLKWWTLFCRTWCE